MRYLLLVLFILPFQLLTAQGLEALQKGDKYAFFLNEERVSDFVYDEASPTDDGGYLVGISGAYGRINELGEITVPIQYDYLTSTGHNSLIAGQNGKSGVIDLEENELLPFIYEHIDQYSASGTAVVKLNDRWGILRNGNIGYDISQVVWQRPETYPIFAGDHWQDTALEKQQKSFAAIIEYIVGGYVASKRVRKEKISGSATVSFVISAEGKVRAPYITDNDNVAFAEVLADIIRKMPNWSAPATVAGKPVAMKYSLPVELAMK